MIKNLQKILLLIFLMISSTVFPQQTIIKGFVFDQSTGKPIPSAEIIAGGQTQLTGYDGGFQIILNSQAEIVLMVNMVGFDSYTIKLKPPVTDALAISLVPRSVNDAERRGITELSLAQLDMEDDSKGQTVSGLLHASGDVFTSTADYTFSAAYFRVRGYDSENFNVYMSGIPINDAESGWPVWAEWGGLNDATRNKEVITGLNPSKFSFGNMGGSTNIITRASAQRKQTKLTYSLSNRTYTNRLMFIYSTGLMKNNWAFSASASRRWGEEGYVDGVWYNAWAYFFSAEKKINNQHSIAFTVLGSPTKRSQMSGSVQEVYDLTGSNYYNANWGYQMGEKRSARVKNFHEPMAIFNHYWDINESTKLTTSIGYSFGYNGTTALNWYKAPDPRPDYYRYLPSYQTDPYVKQLVEDAWQNSSTSQINWDNLYQVNYLAKSQGKQSNYMIEDRRNDQELLSLSVLLNKTFNSKSVFSGGIDGRIYTGKHFKTVDDLLGGTYWVDIDQFAERDFVGDSSRYQNDLNNPNRVVKEGDVFGYNYNIRLNEVSAWGQQEFTFEKFDVSLSAKVGYTEFWRDGKMKNGNHPDNSYGKSKTNSFITPSIKAGLTYKITGRHFVVGNIGYFNTAPYLRDVYLSPRVRDDVAPDLQAMKTLSGDLSYILRSPGIKARFTVYNTHFKGATEIRGFYHDDLKTFVNLLLSNVDKVHQGIEFGTEVKVTSTVSVTCVAAIGNYRYTSRPTGTISFENGSQADTTETIYCMNFYVPGSPQTAASIGLNYRHPKYWFFNANLNYFGNIYLDFNPARRTSGAIENIGPGDPKIELITAQEKKDDQMTLDLSIGKSIQIDYKYFININFSVSNVLDNRKLVTGGYEQLRYDYETQDVSKFPPKYFYGFGRTYYLNLGFRF